MGKKNGNGHAPERAPASPETPVAWRLRVLTVPIDSILAQRHPDHPYADTWFLARTWFEAREMAMVHFRCDIPNMAEWETVEGHENVSALNGCTVVMHDAEGGVLVSMVPKMRQSTRDGTLVSG